MTDDVRLAVSLRRHRKTKRLKRILGGDGCWALVCLFLWVGEERWTGDLIGLTDDDLEEEADWDGDRGSFIAALIEVGFMDGEPMARSIHDWAEHNPYASGKGQRIEKAKQAANARWNKHASSMPVASYENATEQCPPTPTPTPTPSQEKKDRTPSAHAMLSGVPTDLVDDFMKIRKSKRSALTQTAVDGIKREASKAGYSLEMAIRTCCERGWQGFKAEWVTGNNQHNNGSNHAQPKLSPPERVAVSIALNNGGEIPDGYENNGNVVAEVERNLRSQVDFSLRNRCERVGGADLGEGIKWLNGGASG